MAALDLVDQRDQLGALGIPGSGCRRGRWAAWVVEQGDTGAEQQAEADRPRLRGEDRDRGDALLGGDDRVPTPAKSMLWSGRAGARHRC